MLKIGKKVESVKYNLTLGNQSVAVFSRMSILSFYSFLESFVNSTGYSFYRNNDQGLSLSEIELLQGKKKDKYLSLENKIEKFPSLIRSDRKTTIITSDPKQIKEPFKSVFNKIKLIRDSSVHFSPIKESIWRPPTDWLNEAKTTSTICIESAKQFWIACYPDSKGPSYLENLDYEKNMEFVRNAINWKTNLEKL